MNEIHQIKSQIDQLRAMKLAALLRVYERDKEISRLESVNNIEKRLTLRAQDRLLDSLKRKLKLAEFLYFCNHGHYPKNL